jgi:hypothetical protein
MAERPEPDVNLALHKHLQILDKGFRQQHFPAVRRITCKAPRDVGFKVITRTQQGYFRIHQLSTRTRSNPANELYCETSLGR